MKISASQAKSLLFMAYFLNQIMEAAAGHDAGNGGEKAGNQIDNSDITLSSGISYLTRKNPYQPDFTFNSTARTTAFTAETNFVANQPGVGYILSGAHIAKTNSGSDIVQKGFEWKNLIKMVDRSLGIIPRIPVNYTEPPCVATSVIDSPYSIFESAVWGFQGEDCQTFQSNHQKRADHLQWRLAAEEKGNLAFLIIACILVGGFAILVLMATVNKHLLKERDRRRAEESEQSVAAPRHTLIFSGATDSLETDVEMQALTTDTEDLEPLLSDTPGITPSLKSYIQGIESQPELRASKLTDEEKNMLINKYDKHPFVCVYCSLAPDLIDIPVTLNGRTYDFASLIGFPPEDRFDPIEKEDRFDPIKKNNQSVKIPFTLDQLQPDRRSNEILRQEIAEVIKNRRAPSACHAVI